MLKKEDLTRRSFLQMAGVAGVGLGLSACRAGSPAAAPAAVAQAEPEAAAEHDAMQMDDIDTAHEAGVKKFLDGIGQNPAFWGAPLAYTMDGNTKVFELTCARIFQYTKSTPTLMIPLSLTQLHKACCV